MFDPLITWVSNIGHWAYLAIFLVVSLESAAFLGFLMPGEALVFLGGFLASQGMLDVRLLVPLVAVAAILGDSIGYELGRLLQKSWFLRYGRWLGLREEHWKRMKTSSGGTAARRFFSPASRPSSASWFPSSPGPCG